MGKYKELDINALNDGKSTIFEEINNDYSIYTKEIINDFINGKAVQIPLSKYIEKSPKRIFLFTPLEGKVHLWDWSNFRDEVNGRLLSYETDQNLILFQIIEIDKSITLTKDLLCRYNLKIEKRFK